MSEEKQAKKKRGPRGAGSVYQNKHTKFWTLQYNGPDGKRIHEPSGTQLKGAAQARLRAAVARVASGGAGYATGPQTVFVRDLYQDLKADTEAKHPIDEKTGKRKGRAVEGLGWRWAHLEPVFGNLPASKVKPALVAEYKKRRREEGFTTATANREVATLRRMFNLGKENERIRDVPKIKTDPEKNTRTGYLQDWEREKLTAAARDLWLRTFFEMVTAVGWRRGELISLTVEQVDLPGRVIRLEPGTTKNLDGRTVPLTPRLETLLRDCVAGKKSSAAVFTWDRGRSKGKPVRDFRVAWRKLFEAAGVELRTVHDMRRTAARNLRRAGAPEGVIMKIGGWRTNAMFRRYDIVSVDDQRDAFERLERSRNADKPSVSLFVVKTEPEEKSKVG
jgi:integrase